MIRGLSSTANIAADDGPASGKVKIWNNGIHMSMDDELEIDSDLGDWIDRAKASVTAFWHPPTGQFIRDTTELKKPLARREKYYPTATFTCVTALHESKLVAYRTAPSAFAKTSPSGEYAAWQFLDVARSARFRSLERIIQESDIFPRRDAKGTSGWNVLTASWALRALAAIDQTLRRVAEPTTSSKPSHQYARDQRTWLMQQVRVQSARIVKHISEGEVGASLAPQKTPLTNDRDAASQVSPYLTYHAVRALKSGLAGGLPAATPGQSAINHLADHAERTCHRILALHRPRSPALGSLTAAAYAAAVLHEVRPGVHDQLVGRVLDVVCSCMAQDGAWPLGRLSFSHEGGDPVFVSTYDLGMLLTHLAWRLTDREKRRQEDEKVRLDAFRALFAATIQSLSVVTVDKRQVIGWGNEHMYEHDRVQSWVCAQVLGFLTNYRRYVQLLIQRQILTGGAYETVMPAQMRKFLTLEQLKASDLDAPQAVHSVAAHFVEPIAGRTEPPPSFCTAKDMEDHAMLPDRDARNVSMILYGPPGTAKTTLAEAVARELRWPLIMISPGVFLRGGEASIDAQASLVFSQLGSLERVVILFDECDELFRMRPEIATGYEIPSSAGSTEDEHVAASRSPALPSGGNGQLSQAALITGAMLPRLKKLHDRGKLIFVLATNRISAIDPAVRRDGRFDRRYAVGPPGIRTITSLLRGRLDLPESVVVPTAKKLAAMPLSYGDLMDFLGRRSADLASLMSASRKTPARVLEEIAALAEQEYPMAKRTIDHASWERFKADSAMTSSDVEPRSTQANPRKK